MEKGRFFSIIVPTRNEEKYISRTISCLKSLDYPKERYEIIIVESGSTDNTAKLIKNFKSKLIKTYSIKKPGVSVARNYGAKKSSNKSDWLIFLDGDTVPKKDFLNRLNQTIENKKNCVIGTIRVKPFEKSIWYGLVFWIYAIFLKFSDASYAIQIVKKKEFNRVRYDENLKVGEDYIIIEKVKKFGNFFFIWQNPAETSIRRWKKWGIIKQCSIWTRAAIEGYEYKKSLNYEVIR